jgi:cytoskeletal protein RodZ
MSLSLGEKLRQAREERGISLTEVAEQTRISPHYLESIERDDYRPLPGGIFNKGFVKSFAKFVNVDEQEALADYSRLIAANETGEDADLKVYRPEVLTDDRSGSMIPTIIMAAVILGIITAGILFLLNYLQNRPETEVSNTPVNSNSSIANSNTSVSNSTSANAPDMATVRVEFRAVSAPVSLAATSDGKFTNSVVVPGTAAEFQPKESLKLSYSKSLASVVQLTINGKSIALPAQPLVPRRNAIEFEINKGNLAQIWQSGAISADVPAAVTDANIQAPTPTIGPSASNTPRPNTIGEPSPEPTVAVQPTPAATPVRTPSITMRPLITNRPANTARPAVTPKPAVNKPQ